MQRIERVSDCATPLSLTLIRMLTRSDSWQHDPLGTLCIVNRVSKRQHNARRTVRSDKFAKDAVDLQAARSAS